MAESSEVWLFAANCEIEHTNGNQFKIFPHSDFVEIINKQYLGLSP